MNSLAFTIQATPEHDDLTAWRFWIDTGAGVWRGALGTMGAEHEYPGGLPEILHSNAIPRAIRHQVRDLMKAAGLEVAAG